MKGTERDARVGRVGSIACECGGEKQGARKQRLDMLVGRRAGITRSRAQALIRAHKVLTADGAPLEKPGRRFAEDLELDIRSAGAYVGRGGEKLEAAVAAFGLGLDGRVAIDVGASTGGFTECLLRHGARRVYAVDVGRGQLAPLLRADPRVIVLEGIDIRKLDAETLRERPDVFTADCSFISLRLVLPSLKALLAEQAEGVVLIKPQFEVGRRYVRKGVIRDRALHGRAIESVLAVARQLGCAVGPVIASPLAGPAGNREFLAHLVVG